MQISQLPLRAGAGFKPEHFSAIAAAPQPVGFFEVHAENYMGTGGAPHAQLRFIRDNYALSLHGVGLNIGSSERLDRTHLGRLKDLCARHQPECVSEHLAWSSHGGVFFNDLLPLPYTEASLRSVIDHVDEAQSMLARRLLIENPATYVRFEESTIPETDFLAAIARATGCGLLLDVNNVRSTTQRAPTFISELFRRTSLKKFILPAISRPKTGKDRPCASTRINRRSSTMYSLCSKASLHAPGRFPRSSNGTMICRSGRRCSPRSSRRKNVSTGRRTLTPLRLRPKRSGLSMQNWQSNFARALLDRELPVPEGVIAHNSERPERRFAVYRNNMMVSLIGALEARFPATCKIAGEEFFKAAARRFIAAEPPRSPIMMFYGDAFPSYLAEFAPARSVPYLADVARLEAARTRAYHAADAKPLTRDALAAAPLDTLTGMRFTLHPSLEIVSSSYPIVTIFAMNSGLMELGPIADWRGEDALVIRPEYEVEVRRLSPGARIFLENLADKKEFGEAAGVASAASADFDLAENLAALFSGLAVAMTRGRTEDGPR
jgi:Protein of unknown function (DUF692)/Putative DNA-binding domain